MTTEPVSCEAGEPVLELEGVCRAGRGETRALDDVTITVRAGEILGVAGVDGNGQAELEDIIVGVVRPKSGTVSLNGRDVTSLATRQRLSLGLGHIPQDRLVQGLVEEMTLTENLLLGRHFDPAFTRRGLLRRSEIRAHAQASLAAFDVRPPLPDAEGGSLSGGNQQKLVAARELSRNLTFLLAAHPTRGVDIAATEFMHGRIREACARGAGVLLISAELSEILALSNRVAVMHRGRVVKVFDSPPTREEVGRHMLGADG